MVLLHTFILLLHTYDTLPITSSVNGGCPVYILATVCCILHLSNCKLHSTS
jgi:hypothetical protein